MARKRKEEEEFDTDGWMNTFSDLMNLLLCFFVLLFSMSSVDTEKYEALVASLSNSFSIFEAGSQAIGEGKLVSSGASQLNQMDEYINDMGKEAEETEDADDPLAELKEQEAEEQREKTETLYEAVLEETEKKELEQSVDVTMDSNYQYVMISLSGGVLFDSGSADIKKGARTLLGKVGDLLKKYDDRTIKILGHTDNVPINNDQFNSNVWLSTARATKVFEYLVDEKGLDPKTLESAGRGEYDPIASNKTANGRAKNRRVEIRIYSMEDK